MSRLWLIALLLLLAACSSSGEPLKVEDQEVAVVQGDPTVLADHLEVPWSIQRAGDVFYISERPGAIVKVENGEQVREKVHLDKPLSEEEEAG
jgi:glucose/arabinose dehydrogenase